MSGSRGKVEDLREFMDARGFGGALLGRPANFS